MKPANAATSNRWICDRLAALGVTLENGIEGTKWKIES